MGTLFIFCFILVTVARYEFPIVLVWVGFQAWAESEDTPPQLQRRMYWSFALTGCAALLSWLWFLLTERMNSLAHIKMEEWVILPVLFMIGGVVLALRGRGAGRTELLFGYTIPPAIAAVGLILVYLLFSSFRR